CGISSLLYTHLPYTTLFRSGSMATQKKVYIGKGKHFYPKTNIGEFLIEAYDLKVGDKILITGPTTGAKETIVTSMMVADSLAERSEEHTSELQSRENLVCRL